MKNDKQKVMPFNVTSMDTDLDFHQRIDLKDLFIPKIFAMVQICPIFLNFLILADLNSKKSGLYQII